MRRLFFLRLSLPAPYATGRQSPVGVPHPWPMRGAQALQLRQAQMNKGQRRKHRRHEIEGRDEVDHTGDETEQEQASARRFKNLLHLRCIGMV